MRRALYWAAVLVGVALVTSGAVVAAIGYTTTVDPAGIVRGYFAALQRGDAAAALAYGSVPPGRRGMLTGNVLAEQQRIAPIRDLAVLQTHRHGEVATVDVKYTLAFPDADVAFSAHVGLHKESGDWRLNRVAVRTTLDAHGAVQRMTVLGAQVPAGPALFFPGALPITLDTPYLELAPFLDSVSFDSTPVTSVALHVTEAGRAAMLRAVSTKLRACLTDSADPTCPLPDERYLPDSLRGVVKGPLRATFVALDETEPIGTLDFHGTAVVAGTWHRLAFTNVAVNGHGRVELDLHARAYAVAPLQLRWSPP